MNPLRRQNITIEPFVKRKIYNVLHSTFQRPFEKPARKTNGAEWFPHSFVNEVSILRCLPSPHPGWHGEMVIFSPEKTSTPEVACRISIAPFVCSSGEGRETEIRLSTTHNNTFEKMIPNILSPLLLFNFPTFIPFDFIRVTFFRVIDKRT